VRTLGSQTFRDLSQGPRLAGGREATQVVGLGSARFTAPSCSAPKEVTLKLVKATKRQEGKMK